MNKYFDWYNFGSIEVLRKSHEKKGMDLVLKLSNARRNGDEVALKKAYQAIIKHRAQGEVYKGKAEEHHYYWY